MARRLWGAFKEDVWELQILFPNAIGSESGSMRDWVEMRAVCDRHLNLLQPVLLF
ncbi:hypothetical protein [Scytonema sp. NUACC21]